MDKVQIKEIAAGQAVAYLHGRLDVAVSSEIEEALLNAIDSKGIKRLVLNMSDVEYMSSSGFRVMIAMLRKLKDLQGSLKICCVSPAVKRIFDVIELTTLFDMYDTDEAALA
ncbi:MAG TPA: STAS domain-containing protein [Turneriella sp.]|nr:STAS domain-containing protein [Turneriella sp.]